MTVVSLKSNLLLQILRRVSLLQILVSLAVVAGAALRLVDLGAWPVFIDEDLYTGAAIDMARVPLRAAVMLPGVVGKPPLSFFLQGGLTYFTGDPLIAGRLFSALAGTVTTILCFFLGNRLGGRHLGLASAVIYALSPLAVLHERMALQDGAMSMLSLAAVLVSWTAIERRSWPLTVAASVLGVLAVQFKMPAIWTAVAPVIILIATREDLRGRVAHAALSAAGPVASYVGLMLSPLGQSLAEQNQSRTALFSSFWVNTRSLTDAAGTYMPGGLLFLVLAGVVLVLVSKRRPALVFLTMILVWLVPWLVLSNFAPSRYYLPAVPYASSLAALALVRLGTAGTPLGRSGRWLAFAILAVVIAFSGFSSIRLVVDHQNSVMTKLDDWQYRSAWPSGYGYKDAVDYLHRTVAPGSSVAFVVDWRHRVAAGLYMPLPKGVKSLGLSQPTEPLPANGDGSTYVIVDDSSGSKVELRLHQVMSVNPQLRLLARFLRPGSNEGVYILK